MGHIHWMSVPNDRICEATANIYVTFTFTYTLYKCVCIWLFFCLLVRCFFFICAYFFSVPFFKWENKWIIISRPPERPISFALGSAVHFAVRIFYEALSTVVFFQFFFFFALFICLVWFCFVLFFLLLLLLHVLFSYLSQSAFSKDKSHSAHSRTNNEEEEKSSKYKTAERMWLYINVSKKFGYRFYLDGFGFSSILKSLMEKKVYSRCTKRDANVSSSLV